MVVRYLDLSRLDTNCNMVTACWARIKEAIAALHMQHRVKVDATTRSSCPWTGSYLTADHNVNTMLSDSAAPALPSMSYITVNTTRFMI